MNPYQLIEDYAGGLHLFVRDAQTDETIFAGRICPDNVQAAIANIDEAHTWDEDMGLLADYLGVDAITTLEQLEDAREVYYRELTHDIYSWELVADEFGIYPDYMGSDTRQALGLALEQDTTL